MSDNVWNVRNVHPVVRRRIRLYALERDITMAEALKELIDLSIPGSSLHDQKESIKEDIAAHPKGWIDEVNRSDS